MMRKFNKRNIITSFGAAALLASLSLGGTAMAADTDNGAANNDQAQTYKTQLEQHKNLQAYTHPLSVQTLTTTKGNLPAATSGISNWGSVPAGTTAAWDNEPDVSKAGTSYGTVYVTFPDGSRSRLAVYVTVKDDGAGKTVTKGSNVAGTAASKGAQTATKNNDTAKSADSNSSVKGATTADKDKVDTSKSNENKDVVVKDLGSTTVTEKNVSVESNSKSTAKNKSKSSNPISVASQLPETVAKATNPFVIVCGLIVAGMGAAVIWSKKLKKRN